MALRTRFFHFGRRMGSLLASSQMEKLGKFPPRAARSGYLQKRHLEEAALGIPITSLYTPDYRESLWKVGSNGGTAERLTNLDVSKHSTHRWPSFLPDGKHFLFLATNHAGLDEAQNGIYLGSVDSPTV